uniref:Uncharacterized protein n=1 Tax=Anguilla anguilla TaxID=7936 RepID=A0A0E9QB06_ANGAN
MWPKIQKAFIYILLTGILHIFIEL